MRKIIALLMSLTVIAGVTACSDKSSESSPSESTTQQVTTEAEHTTALVNRMNAEELGSVKKHALTLLDEPEDTAHTVAVEKDMIATDDALAKYKGYLEDGTLTEEEYNKCVEYTEEQRANGEETVIDAVYVLIDGCYYTGLVPPFDYDGGELEFSEAIYVGDSDGGDEDGYKSEYYTVPDAEAYFEHYRKQLEKEGNNAAEVDSKVRQSRLVFDAIMNKTYEELPEGTVNFDDPNSVAQYFGDPFADYRSVWEYDRAEVEAIKDSVEEYEFYDSELDRTFLVHVILPPNYKKNYTYPMVFLTDGVWRFGNTPALRRAMEDGEAAEVILATLAFDYKTDSTDLSTRYSTLVIERDGLLDFVTDNVMPYLCEQYNIDNELSTLFGHSDGGVFAHNALFKSDKYENQPFGKYIIGSPSFWGLYDDDFDLDVQGCLNDYGYFDRNEKLGKAVFLCGGSLEDPDYEEQYRGHDTTLEGLEKLYERLQLHDAYVTYKLYESHHYQYIPEMLLEYLRETYPA